MKDIMDLVIKVLKGALYVNPNILDKYNEEILSSDNEELSINFENNPI